MKNVVLPIAKALKSELKANKKDMEAMRGEFIDAKKDMASERNAQRKAIRGVAHTLQRDMQVSLSLNLSLRLMFKGLLLYTGGVLFRVEWFIRQL